MNVLSLFDGMSCGNGWTVKVIEPILSHIFKN